MEKLKNGTLMTYREHTERFNGCRHLCTWGGYLHQGVYAVCWLHLHHKITELQANGACWRSASCSVSFSLTTSPRLFSTGNYWCYADLSGPIIGCFFHSRELTTPPLTRPPPHQYPRSSISLLAEQCKTPFNDTIGRTFDVKSNCFLATTTGTRGEPSCDQRML